MKYHRNSKGKLTICKAEKRNCPYQHIPDINTPPSDLTSLLPQITDKPGLKNLQEEWDAKFKDLNEWEQQNGELTYSKYEELVDPRRILDSTPEAARPRGSELTRFGEYDEEEREILSGYGLNDEDYILEVSTRQGGGNRECWCSDDEIEEEGHHCYADNIEKLQAHPNYLTDQDDSFDNTYATFYYKVDKAEEEIKAFEKTAKEIQKLRQKKNILESVKTGEVTPWKAVTDTANNTGYSRFKLNQSVKELNTLAQKSETKKALEKILSTGQYGDLKDNPLRLPAYKVTSLALEVKANREAQDNLKRSEMILESANSLPEGPLKEYLVGDRGVGTYQTTEKQGRRNVKVTKTYSKGTLLGKDHETAKRTAESSARHLDSSIKNILDTTGFKDVKPEKVEELKDSIASELSKRDLAWEAGWPGNQEDLPRVPEGF